MAVAQLAVYLHGHSVAFKTFGRVLGAYNSKSRLLASKKGEFIGEASNIYTIASEAGSTFVPPTDKFYGFLLRKARGAGPPYT
jgi:hypothetical protein